jgi:catechol 2,3-dioxygenase-like lactoylglutathione lyase family enzyme
VSDHTPFPFRSNGDVAVHVTDIAAAKAFYGGVLGFRLIAERDGHLSYDTGVFTLWVNRDDRVQPYIPAYSVPSYGEARERLVAAGCTILREWPDSPHPALYFADPFGIVGDVIEQRDETA